MLAGSINLFIKSESSSGQPRGQRDTRGYSLISVWDKRQKWLQLPGMNWTTDLLWKKMIVRNQPIFTYLILGPGCVKLENLWTESTGQILRRWDTLTLCSPQGSQCQTGLEKKKKMHLYELDGLWGNNFEFNWMRGSFWKWWLIFCHHHK